MLYFENNRGAARKLVALLLVLCFAANVLVPALPAAAADERPFKASKTIIPQKISAKIFDHAKKIVSGVCEHLSRHEGWEVRSYCSLIDERNRIFFAVKGKISHRWPFRDIDRDNVLKIETDGNITIDFFLTEASSKNGVVTYEFSADAIIMLDDLAVSLSKYVAGMGASAAIGFAVKNLSVLLANIDSKLLAGAIAKACGDFSKCSFNASFETIAESLKDYENKGDIYKRLISGIRNGNLLSFLVFNIINVGAHQAANVAGAALGSVIGTALFPGAGTIVGGLVANAASLIITKFVINKIGSEWFLKLELQRFIHLSREVASDASDAAAREKYEKRLANVVEKLRDEFSSNDFNKFNTLVHVVETDDKADVVHLKPVVTGINEFLHTRIVADNDMVASRKYLQLRQAAAKRGLERQLGY